MSERLDKQTERLDQVERRVSAVEDGQTALASGQLKVNTELDTLKHKMDDLKSRSRRNNLRILVQEYRDTEDTRTSGHIRAKMQEFQETALSEVRHMGKYAVARAYGKGDRPGKALANLIHPSRSTNLINKTIAADGSILIDPEDIAARFREYYQTLYTTRGNPKPNAIKEYLTHIELQKLSESDRAALGAPFTLGKIAKELGSMAEVFEVLMGHITWFNRVQLVFGKANFLKYLSTF
ncbi:hypothetical protein NDU88_003243 [Pleurodeles waltl]|uniref:Uncharacterized protein n=1 Tax=Pleurodeles waltl TaxID=8319 RepID=A0AAV7PCD2_PLEWA|nr:hypothetical protein NDU88_003243 [Pleurodeles waltl]